MRRLSAIDLRLLRIFTTVVDCNGFQNAQLALNMAQSTLSTHIASLEAKLGSRLCERGRRGFRLTRSGEETYLAAQDLFRAIEGFEGRMGRVHGNETERLRLGVIDTVATSGDLALAAAIGGFCEAHPNVLIDLEVLPPEQLQRAAAEGRRDVVIGPSFQPMPSLTYRDLMLEEHQLFCGRGHPWFARDDATITREDFRAARFSVRAYQYFDDVYRLGKATASATVSNMEAQLILILSGGFVGFLPRHLGELWAERSAMRAIKPRQWTLQSRFFVAYDDAMAPQALKRAFVGHLEQAARQLARPA